MPSLSKEAGRPGHEGLFRIEGQPVAGETATLRVSLSASATKTSEFYLVTERGEAIQKFAMQAINSDRELLEFVGRVDLPKTPFRVAVMGRDSNGRQYQRFFANLFHAESVGVSSPQNLDQLSVGSTAQIAFTMRNVGVPRTFKVTVTDVLKFVSDVEPKTLELGAGESGTVRVDLTVPVGATPGGGDDLVVLATSTEGPPTSNSDVVHLSVTSSQNPR
jgi:hypothetical protein